MTTLFILVLVWVILTLKTSRPDGMMVGYLHPYRKLLLYIMPTKAESTVYYEDEILADGLLEYVEQAREKFDANMSHVLVAATAGALRKNPNMNRFVMGRRLYQRDGVWITFSMKRKKLDKKSKLATVKLEMFGDETFAELTKRVNEKIDVQRSDQVTYEDRELGLFAKVPRPILRFFVELFKTVDYFNLLPGEFIENDGLYTSAFLANLGSLGMKPGYHHLFEWGNCPIFIMVGEVEERVVAVEGKPAVRKVLPLKVTYDERLDDGLTAKGAIDTIVEILSNPADNLGCVTEDGTDTFPLGEKW